MVSRRKPDSREGKTMKKAVVVLSGGLDSTTLLYDTIKCGYEALPISFDYRQKHSRELDCAKDTCKKLGLEHMIVDLGEFSRLAPSALTRDLWDIPHGHYADENMKQTVVPNRNMVMLSLATAYAIGKRAKVVFYGAHAGDHAIYPDCRPEFLKAMQKAISLCDWTKVRLEAPYIEMDKGDIVEIGLKLGVDYELTHTCYEGGEIACGKCGSCVERLEAFSKNKVKDPLSYRVKI